METKFEPRWWHWVVLGGGAIALCAIFSNMATPGDTCSGISGGPVPCSLGLTVTNGLILVMIVAALLFLTPPGWVVLGIIALIAIVVLWNHEPDQKGNTDLTVIDATNQSTEETKKDNSPVWPED